MTITSKLIKAASQHPVSLVALGVAPLIMKCETLLSAIMISAAFSIILILSNISVSGLRTVIPQQTHLVIILIITSTWTTVVDLLLQTWFYEMHVLIDIYIPIIAMNSLLLMVLQSEALQNPVSRIYDKLLVSISLVLILCVITGASREILAYGVILSDWELLFPSMPTASFKLMPGSVTLPLFNKVSGAYIALGCIIALLNLVFEKAENSSAAYFNQQQ